MPFSLSFGLNTSMIVEQDVRLSSSLFWQMRSSMKEILAREDRLASQNSVLVTLVAGTQEEIKVSDDALFHNLPASVKELGF